MALERVTCVLVCTCAAILLTFQKLSKGIRLVLRCNHASRQKRQATTNDVNLCNTFIDLAFWMMKFKTHLLL
jgi:hypothetical protein